ALPRIRTNIGNKTVAALTDAQVARDPCCRYENGCQHGPVFCRQLRHRGDVTPWNEQDMSRRLGVDILKRHTILILINNLTRYHACCNLAEQAVLNNHTSAFLPRYSSHLGSPPIVPHRAMAVAAYLTAKRASRASLIQGLRSLSTMRSSGRKCPWIL